MSFFKKIGAVTLGVGTAAGWLASNAVKAAFEATADKLGNGTTSNGYSASDYRSKAKEIEGKDDLWKSGFKKTKELWNDED